MEDKTFTDEEIIDKVNIISKIYNVKIQLYPYIAPENIDNSKIIYIINDKYCININDLIKQKEISKYVKDKNKLIELINKYCEFFENSEKEEYIKYNIPDNMSVFSILNIPQKLKKEEVCNNLELINLKYNRLYKNGFYWNLCTTDKETLICVQNSLRTLTYDDMTPKYSIKSKEQISELIKEQVEKVTYQKEVKNLGVNKIIKDEKKASNVNSDAFSWRKGSSESGNNYDYNDKRYKKSYYNNYKKRKRFNSDNGISNNQKDDYKEYKPYNNDFNKDIEIDITKLKYPLQIKYKYSFKEFQNIFENMKIIYDNPYKGKNIFNELISEKPKKILSFKENKEDKKEGVINTNINIPKMNPLSNIGKGNFLDKKDI